IYSRRLVALLFTSPCIMDFFFVNRIKGSKANGIPKERITCDITIALVGEIPLMMMKKEGSIVTNLLTKSGMGKETNPCIMICPAIVPTTEELSPEDKRAIPNRYFA